VVENYCIVVFLRGHFLFTLLTVKVGRIMRVGRCSDWREWNEANSVWNTEQAMSAATISLSVAPVVCFTFSTDRFVQA